ncbi:glycoside hydrolase [Bacteroides sp. OttesenSCG-928-D19]|nr:glycoside hydrolase [Bacteroides sp. OttesenSCG-928-D19]
MKKHVLLVFLLTCCFSFTIYSENYKGKWVSFEHTQSAPNSWYMYRKDVTLANVPAALTARIAVDSKYWLWINDRLVVFEGGLKRGPARNATYYDEVEIAPFLTAGENTIAVLVWHFGRNGFSHVNSGMAGLWFEAIGSGIEIISDDSWKGRVYDAYQHTDAPHPNYRLPESNIRFDARKEVIGWNKKSFAGAIQKPFIINDIADVPIGQLVKRPIPLWKDYGLTEYTTIRKSAKGDTLFCRLPYNCHITPYLKVKASAGATIRMQTDNYLGGAAPNVRAEYITREGEQEYESFGWMNGHEVWYILPEGVEVIEVKYRETGYDTEFVAPFRCNDSFYNELWKRSARTLYVTMRDTYMDCPDRERAQWWGDEVNELGETFYALTPSSHQLALKGIYELMNWQRTDGVLYSPVPAGNWNRELPLQILASVGWYGFYTQYFYSADSSFIPVIYDRLHKYLHEVWEVDYNGLPIERAGDWTWGDWGQNVDLGMLTTCWYYLALKAEREFAQMLKKTSDVEEIQQMMSKIEKSFDLKFWTDSAYRSPGYKGETDDRAQAMAIVSGLAPKEKYPALLDVLKKEYHASPYMEKYVLEALFLMDEPELALKRMKQRYEYMLSFNEYTTLFEGWGIGEQDFGGGTINHAWSGGPLTLLSQKVCGIEPTSPGFRTFRVKPQLGSLKDASTTIASVSGEIKVSVAVKRNKMTICVDVPEGTTAEVVFPDGKTVKKASGLHTLTGCINLPGYPDSR